jgi:hypothetical protein
MLAHPILINSCVRRYMCVVIFDILAQRNWNHNIYIYIYNCLPYLYQLTYWTFIFTVTRFYVTNEIGLHEISHIRSQIVLLFTYSRWSRIEACRSWSTAVYQSTESKVLSGADMKWICIAVYRTWTVYQPSGHEAVYQHTEIEAVSVAHMTVKLCISLLALKLYIRLQNMKFILLA